ncbi:TPA: hypothetical protein IUU06_002070 [Enterococcus faecalis]|uniref:hypothetical protein n=1 Tax=Enterococcus faecalis TaxID=1351 RepID=UPI000668373D|nr:hypothetical protein [Enterococcus faecalis]HAP3876009.1 hypothetical protein [Enterococcus faecalis]HAP3957106.1 hypothetical protein [Enterococcus faecalis]HAP3978656.1 hypothetical protein [Enterococcus faecalis]HAP4056920.1 hypothetical protein [Enterococcus faecalis]HAP4324502.1 hypothetical protein [Enterococcus faecalis]
MSKRVVAGFRWVEKDGNNFIQTWADTDDVESMVCAAMIVEYLANKHKVSPRKIIEALLSNIEVHPMDFKEGAK